MKALIRAVAILIICVIPGIAHACACGCGIFDVGTSSMFPEGKGGIISLEYNYLDQNRNWHGTSKAPSANNDDKDIRSSFYTAGLQYMFNRQWGFRVTVPYWDRHVVEDDGGGLEAFDHSNLGDVRLTGIYTGLSPDMSSGLTFGVKLPTGDYDYSNFERDTSIGTGSTDLLLGAYHMGHFANADWSWFLQGTVDIPVLTRGDYRPGDELDAAGGAYYEGWRFQNGIKIVPLAQIIAVGKRHDSGAASDPDNSGYTRLLVAPGLELDLGKTRLYADVEIPVYQNVNGNQLVADTFLKVVASFHF